MRNTIDVRHFREVYGRLAASAEAGHSAPEEVVLAVDGAFRAVDEAFRSRGFKTVGDDRAEELVGAITAYMIDANPHLAVWSDGSATPLAVSGWAAHLQAEIRRLEAELRLAQLAGQESPA